MPPHIRDGFAELITQLEAAKPDGLDSRRTSFKTQGQVDKGSQKFMKLSLAERQEQKFNQLLNDRFELLIGAQLLRAGALTRMRTDTPDFECRWGDREFGVEATTRARPEVAEALAAALDRALWDGPDVSITLMRSGKLLFSESPAVIAAASDHVVTEVKTRVADGQQFGSLAVPDLGLTAMWRFGTGSVAGTRVSYESVLTFTQAEWDHHWKMAALQVKDTIKEKGSKTYDLPSVLVVDVSRLGETSRLLSPGGLTKFQEVLDDSDLGNLRGALLVRTTLTSRVIEPLRWHDDDLVVLAAGVMIFGEHWNPFPVG